jgi:hypothetical protein
MRNSPTLIAIAGAVVALAACGRQSDDHLHAAGAETKAAVDNLGRAIDTSVPEIKDAGHALGQDIRSAGHEIAPDLRAAGHDIRNGADKAGRGLKDAGDRAKDNARNNNDAD